MLQDILTKWSLNPSDLQLTLDLAEEYVSLKQYSAALSHYIKLAENLPESDYEARYHCLMMIAYIYKVEGSRWLGSIQYARFAKAECPDRPEAYMLLAEMWAEKLYSSGVWEQGDWIQVYENARIGIMYAQAMNRTKASAVYYKGVEYLKCYYIISLLRLNKHTELKQYLKETEFESVDDPFVMNTVYYVYNELRLWNPYCSYHVVNDYDNIRFRFNGLDSVVRNYSQMMQDIFALTICDKSDGTWLEIGSADPTYGSNTKLLEELGWTGISIDYNNWFVNEFNQVRKSKAYCMNALEVDYISLISRFFNESKDSYVIDYLSLDIDPAPNTLECLYRLPLDRVRFNVITFEHDSYNQGTEVRDASRKLLTSKGYLLIAPDIRHNLSDPYEDWWVHVDALNIEKYNQLKELGVTCEGNPTKIFYK